VNAFVRAALAGAATGARSFTGLAALTLATPPGSATQPDRALSLPWVKGLVTLAAAQELVMDKLPQAPSRLGVMGLGARVAAGTTVTAAWLGATWRRLAARRFGTDYVGAGAEDLFATSLAWTATRI